MKASLLVSSSAILLASMTAGAAQAQSAEAAGPAATTPAAADGSAEIVVTAQRRAENQVDVPIAITTLSGAELSQNGVKDFSALQQMVPGLQVTFAAGNTQPVLRGVGTQVASAGLPANIATYIDGFYRPIQLTTNVPFDGVSGIEVLKGPQGTLYGRNATGGAILISTRSPQFTPDAQFHLSYGSYNDTLASAFITAPVSDTVALSAFGYANMSSGYVHNIVLPVDDNNYTALTRLKALIQPSDAFKITLSFEYTKVDDPANTVFTPYNGQIVAALIPSAVYATKPRDYASDIRGIYQMEAFGLFMRMDYDFGGATLSSLTGYEQQKGLRQADFDFSQLALLHVRYPERENVLQQEFDLVSNGAGAFQWSAGVSYLRDKPNQLPVEVINFDPVLLSVKGHQKQESLAGYVEGTLNFAERFSLTAGLRYSEDTFDAVTNGLPTYTDVIGHAKQHALTPRVALRYKFDPQAQLYASFNQGYKAGGFNTIAVSPTAVRPEKIDAYEVGFKINRPSFNFQTAAYLYNYKDIQVNAYQGITNVLLNAARARIYGAEAHLGYRVSDALTADIGASYVHARYRSFPTAVKYEWVPGTGVAVSPQDAQGNPLPVSPDFTATFGLTYVQPLEQGRLKFTGNASYTSRIYFDPFKQLTQGGYEQVNLRAAYESERKDWEAGVYVQNATARDYIKSGVLQQTGLTVQYGAPLRVGVELIIRPFSR